METKETAETSGDAHQGDRARDKGDCRDQWKCSSTDKKSERRVETEGDKGDWRDYGDQWKCSPRDKKSERQVETEGDRGDERDYGDLAQKSERQVDTEEGPLMTFLLSQLITHKN